ncbi:MAG: UDPGP type 1 family protein [Kiritimatiellae bacterium]|jgi:UDP-N-acetylglucosamine/UDP-N-acetylgalactosamine diphosphorylase|nr:UDPGP type 1 family protein [Kiritimatiellia bacterium]
MEYNSAVKVLEECNQSHLLKFWNELSETEQTELLAQLDEVDFASLNRMKDMLQEDSNEVDLSSIEPSPVIELTDADNAKYIPIGEACIAAGEAGVILVAGGQGSRLGYDGPKGCYPVGPVSDASLFEIHARKILAYEIKYKTEIPFYIMTSIVNNDSTIQFFEENNYFGLSKDRVKFFTQGLWPALTQDGKMILDGKGHIFMSPDGHGGLLRALKERGMFEDMKARGVKTLFFFQVDNPLVNICDPAFLGCHIADEADVSVKVCAKRDPDEGLGVVITNDEGKNSILEYSELTDEQKNEKRADGKLRLLYGSVAIHVFSFNFLVKEADADMPIHVAHKKVPFCNDSGETISPEKPNAYKLEKFIFDILPKADKSVNIAFDRAEEFAALKNPTGNDSPETVKSAIIDKTSKMLEKAGYSLAKDDNEYKYAVEIDPAFAAESSLQEALGQNFELICDMYID